MNLGIGNMLGTLVTQITLIRSAVQRTLTLTCGLTDSPKHTMRRCSSDTCAILILRTLMQARGSLSRPAMSPTGIRGARDARHVPYR